MAIENPPSAHHATSAKIHAGKTNLRQARTAPTRIAMAAAPAHNRSEPGQRIATPAPDANAAKIHTAGSFIDLVEVERSSPCGRSEETDQLSELLCNYTRRKSRWQGLAPASEA